MNEKQMRMNLFFTAFSFICSVAINFYITPQLSENLGDAAYGFVGMANDFVSYASIISAVLNSVAARFIAVEIYQGKYDRANIYYASVFIVNILLASILLIVGFIFVGNIDKIFHVPTALEGQVKLTFGITFLNYLIVLCTSIFTVCTYVTNRLDIAGIRNSISYAIKFVIVFLLFKFFGIRMYYVAVATIISSIFLGIANIKLTKKLLPNLKFNYKNFDMSYVKVLALSGIWLSISNLSQVLMTGLDSVIANKMLGADAMGILSVSRTVPNAIVAAISTLGVIFTPNFVELYAKGKNNELIAAAKRSIKVMAIALGVPVIGVCVFGEDFYTLWLPSKTEKEIILIQTISILMLIQSIFNLLTISIAQLSVVTNRLKTPVFVSTMLGIANILIVIPIVKYTDLGLYAIAGISSILFIVRYLIFNPLYAAHILNANRLVFYSTLIKCLLALGVVAVVYCCIKMTVEINSWKTFITVVLCSGIIGYLIVIIMLGNIHKVLLRVREKKGEKNKR